MKIHKSKRAISIFLVLILFLPLTSVAIITINKSVSNGEENTQALDVKSSPIPDGEVLPPGVLGTPYEFEDITGQCALFAYATYTPIYIPWIWDPYYLEIPYWRMDLAIDVPASPYIANSIFSNTGMLLQGPYLTQQDFLIGILAGTQWIKSYNIQVHRTERYCPVFLIESEPWYDHTFEFITESSQTSEFTYETGFHSNIAGSGVSFWDGLTTATTTSYSESWTYSARNGSTNVVYLRMFFLHASGTVTFWNNQVFNYDTWLCYDIDFTSTFSLTYLPGEEISESEMPYLPEGYPVIESYQYGMGDIVEVSWATSSTITRQFGVELEAGYEGSPAEVNVDIGFTVKFDWKTSSTTSNAIKHTFTRTTTPVPYYARTYYNAFSLNFEPA